MKNRYLLCMTLAIVCIIPPAWGETNAPALKELDKQEAIRRRAAELYAGRLLERGLAEHKAKRYRDAIDLLAQALKNVGNRPELAETRSRIRAALADSCYERALELLKMQQYDKAATMARDAAVHGHRKGDKLVKKIKKLQGRR